jgi:hypothetical protein
MTNNMLDRFSLLERLKIKQQNEMHFNFNLNKY